MFRRIIVATVATAALTATALATAHPAAAQPAARPAAVCSSYQVVTVRGTGEGIVDGVPSSMVPAVNAIKARVNGVTTFNVPYPAAFDFGESMAAGRAAFKQHLIDVAARCPAQKVVPMGYSQGAIVIGDLIEAEIRAGRNLPVGVLAIILFGDGRFNGAARYNYGTYDPGRSSFWPRSLTSLARYANRIRDYCNIDDPACQWFVLGGGHTDYPKYASNVGTFVASRV